MKGQRVEVTFLDVGWGDSILIEARDHNENASFALVDSNDTSNYPSSLIFLKRYFERLNLHPFPFPLFEHVFTTHAHADHINGIQSMLRRFGAKNLYSSQCDQANNKNMVFANLIRWANTATRNNQKVIQNQAYLSQYQTVLLGPARIDVLWPPFVSPGVPWDRNDENNNSLVLALTLGQVRFLLTGDCIAANWDTTKTPHILLPANSRMVQHPHHGAKNGLFDANNHTPLLDQILAINQQRPASDAVVMGLSCHVRPHHHPHPDVVKELDQKNVTAYRTDRNCHTTFRTDGSTLEIHYSHV
jgi:competence protein ComEC